MDPNYWHTPQGIWRQTNPTLYQIGLQFQDQMLSAGFAWHNVFADECTPDFSCCRNVGQPKVRINRFGEFRTATPLSDGEVLAKRSLVHGAYYLSAGTKARNRAMCVGMWESKKERFLCIKPPKFGIYEIYEMPHVEDDSGTVVFYPIMRVGC